MDEIIDSGSTNETTETPPAGGVTGEAGAAPGSHGDQGPEGPEGGGGSRSADRIGELIEQNRALSYQLQALGQRVEQGQRGSQKWEVPEALKEIDGALGPYMRHYLNPLAQIVEQLRGQHEQTSADLRDEHRFYRSHRDLTDPQAALIEQAAGSLRQKFGQVEREDVLRYLRGHPEHGTLFAKRAVAPVDAGTRAAAASGGRAARATGAAGSRGAPDLSKMSPEERVKHFETTLAGEAF